jgi:hypothetical protein
LAEAAPLLDRLDAAVTVGLREAGDASTFRFADVLTQEVLYAELSTTARHRLRAELLTCTGVGAQRRLQ